MVLIFVRITTTATAKWQQKEKNNNHKKETFQRNVKHIIHDVICMYNVCTIYIYINRGDKVRFPPPSQSLATSLLLIYLLPKKTLMETLPGKAWSLYALW